MSKATSLPISLSVLGEPSFKSLADMETPSGMSSDLSETAGPSQPADLATDDILSSTAIDGYASVTPTLDVSSIETEVLFCEKCGQIFQK